MGGPAGSVWDGNSDADLGSLYSFLDVQHMRGGRASSFLWKSDRISGRYPVAFGNLPVEKEKTANEKRVSTGDHNLKGIRALCLLSMMSVIGTFLWIRKEKVVKNERKTKNP